MKKKFDLNVVLLRIEKAVAAYPKAAMFELFERGYTSVFEQLMACMISIRTFDETSVPVSERLFAKARTPKALLQLKPNELEKLLHGSSFPGQKAYNMLDIAKTAVEKYNNELPADYNLLISLKGVGPKCAHLALGVAMQVPGISVDIHVHRVVNRWGYVQAAQPEKTLAALEHKVPREKWIDINRLLMPFGKHICTGKLPHCSTCPVLEYCCQVGVTKHR
jgi:endonuclease-3